MESLSGYLGIPVLLVAVILQSTLAPEIRIGGGMPDLVYLTVLAWGLLAGFRSGLIWALMGGILQDLVSSVPLGTTSLGLVLVVTAPTLVLGQVNPRNLVYPCLAAAAGTFALHGVTLAVLTVLGQGPGLLHTLVYVTVPGAIYNLVVMALVYRVMGGFYMTVRPRRLTGFE